MWCIDRAVAAAAGGAGAGAGNERGQNAVDQRTCGPSNTLFACVDDDAWLVGWFNKNYYIIPRYKQHANGYYTYVLVHIALWSQQASKLATNKRVRVCCFLYWTVGEN